MADPDTVGLFELSSVAIGYQVQDAMLKAANVDLLIARTICSGKYLIVVGGDTSGVTASIEAGEAAAPEGIIESIVIPRVHPSIFPAISGAVELKSKDVGALGSLETFSASGIIEAADAAVKAADVTLFRVHLAMALGGKGFFLITGDVSAVEAAIAAAEEVVMDHGTLVAHTVIPRPRNELFREYI